MPDKDAESSGVSIEGGVSSGGGSFVGRDTVVIRGDPGDFVVDLNNEQVRKILATAREFAKHANMITLDSEAELTPDALEAVLKVAAIGQLR